MVDEVPVMNGVVEGGSGSTTTLVCLTVFFVALATSIYQWAKKPLKTLQSIGVPVAAGYMPFIGHIIEESKYKHFGACLIESIQRYGKVFGIVQFRQPNIVVSDPEILKEILIRQFNCFTDRSYLPMRSWMEQSLLEQRGVEWKRIRTMLTPFFSSGKMKQHVKIMLQCSDTLVENLNKVCTSGKSNSFDAHSVAEAFAMDVICGCGYGLNTDSQNDPSHPLIRTLRQINNISLVSPKLFLAFTFPIMDSLMKACHMSMFPAGYLKFFESTVRQLIDERKKNPTEREDFLETLVRAEEEYAQYNSNTDVNDVAARKGLDNEEVLAQALLFFLAGYGTSAGALTFLMYNLATHPHVQAKLHAEIQQHLGKHELPGYESIQKLQYLDCCLDESLRLYPASFIFDRVAVEDVTISGLHLPKGTAVIVPVWAIHRDPQLYPDPDSFNPDRFLDGEGSDGGESVRRPVDEFSLLQFGAGQRMCIGARFARLEVKLAIIRILSKFTLKTNEQTQIPVELEGNASVFVNPKGEIRLSLEPRTVSS